MKSILCGFAFFFSVTAFARLDEADQKALADAKAKAKLEQGAAAVTAKAGDKVKAEPTGQDKDKADGTKAMTEARKAREKAAAKKKAEENAEAWKKAREKLFGKKDKDEEDKPLTPEEEAAVLAEVELKEHAEEIEAIVDNYGEVANALGRSYGDPNTNQQSSISYGSFSNRTPFIPGAYEANRYVTELDTSKMNECAAENLRVTDADAEKLAIALANKTDGHHCSDQDTDRLTCMVCNLHFETGNQRDAGQIAAGQTVMTRTFSTAYRTNTVCKTVWAPSQYSWTMNNVVLPENRFLPKDIATLRRLVKNANQALCLGPSDYTNYYAWSIVSPYWAKPGTACAASGIRKLQDHNFCAINATKDREFRDVLRAEGIMDSSGNVKASDGPPATSGK